VRVEYNTIRLHAGVGDVTPDDEHHGPATCSARPGATHWPEHATNASPTARTEQEKTTMTAHQTWLAISPAQHLKESDAPQERHLGSPAERWQKDGVIHRGTRSRYAS
jgi:hypothetical protein